MAGDRADVLAMLRLLLALVEVTERTSNLESVDMPGLLYNAGLIDEAIAYCGGETRRVPLAHAYDLAARLGRADDPAGRRIFDLIELRSWAMTKPPVPTQRLFQTGRRGRGVTEKQTREQEGTDAGFGDMNG